MDPEKLAKAANANQSAIKVGGMKKVAELVEQHSLVFGVWQDKAKPNGIGYSVVKGVSLLKVVVGSAVPVDMTWTAIPCIDAEQAEALRRVKGDGL